MARLATTTWLLDEYHEFLKKEKHFQGQEHFFLLSDPEFLVSIKACNLRDILRVAKLMYPKASGS